MILAKKYTGKNAKEIANMFADAVVVGDGQLCIKIPVIVPKNWYVVQDGLITTSMDEDEFNDLFVSKSPEFGR